MLVSYNEFSYLGVVTTPSCTFRHVGLNYLTYNCYCIFCACVSYIPVIKYVSNGVQFDIVGVLFRRCPDPRPWIVGSSAPVLCWMLGCITLPISDDWICPEIDWATHLINRSPKDLLLLGCYTGGVPVTLQVTNYLLGRAQQRAFLLKPPFDNYFYCNYLPCLDLSVCCMTPLSCSIYHNYYPCYYIMHAYRRVIHIYRRAQQWTFDYFCCLLSSGNPCMYLLSIELQKLSFSHDYKRIQHWIHILYSGTVHNMCCKYVAMFAQPCLYPYLCLDPAVPPAMKFLPHQTARGNRKLGIT